VIKIDQIDTTHKDQVRKFILYPFKLYGRHPQWVPPLLIDSATQLNRNKHPYYEHSDADFFIAHRDHEVVGRIAALVNNRHNEYHGTHQAQFYLFDCIDDQEVANELFARVFDWAHQRKLNRIVGPKGFGVLDGYGIQVEGYEHRQMMNMMNYNYPYYSRLVEAVGFTKEVDFASCHLDANGFHLPERVHRIAERVQKRGTLQVKNFRSKGELRQWAGRIGKTYNQAFIHNWEYYPLTENEVQFLLDNLMVVAVPKLIKVIIHEQDVVGFLFGFPDISAAMQRARGRLLPFGVFDMLLELRRTKWIAMNGAGVLPEYQGLGGNALLYNEVEKTLHDFSFTDADLTQVAETAVQMRSDLINLGGIPYKNHRVFGMDV
jgi:hypothetical protein